jgi:hypothetical protein
MSPAAQAACSTCLSAEGTLIVRQTDLHVRPHFLCLQEARYIAGVQRFHFDRELAPYDLNRYSQWVSLSCHISEHVLQELLPVSGLTVMVKAKLLSPF